MILIRGGPHGTVYWLRKGVLGWGQIGVGWPPILYIDTPGAGLGMDIRDYRCTELDLGHGKKGVWMFILRRVRSDLGIYVVNGTQGRNDRQRDCGITSSMSHLSLRGLAFVSVQDMVKSKRPLETYADNDGVVEW